MKKLIIASLTVLTTIGISAYTNGNSQPLNKLKTIENQADITNINLSNAANTMISNQVDRANLAQAD